MTKSEVNKVVDAVCEYFKIDIKKMSLKESIEFYSHIYHSVNVQ